MNFITATLELRSHHPDQITLHGITYSAADAVIPATDSRGETRFRLLCYTGAASKNATFKDMKVGKRALISGHICFGNDSTKPLDIQVSTIETNIPGDMYVNQVVMGNTFFTKKEPKDKGTGKAMFCKIGTTLDNSDTTTWLFLEVPDARKKKLSEYYRSGRNFCVQGYLREYRAGDNDEPYRALVATEFTVRKEKAKLAVATPKASTAVGYDEIDPTPEGY